MVTKELDEGTLDEETVSTSDELELNTDEAISSDDDDGAAAESLSEKDEFTVTIGASTDDEADEAEFHGPAPKWVKDMRKQNREQRKRLRQLEQELATKSQAQPQAQQIVLGEKPTLEKLEYDTVKYEQALAEWYERKKALDDQQAVARAQAEAQQRKWNERLTVYMQDKVKLGADDFDDAETVVKQYLDVVQQGIIVHGAKDAARLMYALGKNPTRAQALGTIKDPVEFAFTAARLEAQLKVNDRKPTVPPEDKVVGSARTTGSVDVTLARLRAEAEKTNDYSKVTAYKRKLKDAKRR